MTKRATTTQPTLFETAKRPADGVTVFAKCPECHYSRAIAISLGTSWCEIDTPIQMAERSYCDRPLHGDELVRMVFDRTEPVSVKRFDDGIETT